MVTHKMLRRARGNAENLAAAVMKSDRKPHEVEGSVWIQGSRRIFSCASSDVAALCDLAEAALDAREALTRGVILCKGTETADALRSLLSHLDTGRAAAPEEG